MLCGCLGDRPGEEVMELPHLADRCGLDEIEHGVHGLAVLAHYLLELKPGPEAPRAAFAGSRGGRGGLSAQRGDDLPEERGHLGGEFGFEPVARRRRTFHRSLPTLEHRVDPQFEKIGEVFAVRLQARQDPYG